MGTEVLSTTAVMPESVVHQSPNPVESMGTEGLSYTLANGTVETAINAEDAIRRCPVLGKMPLEQANVLLELATVGQQKMDAEKKPKEEVERKPKPEESEKSKVLKPEAENKPPVNEMADKTSSIKPVVTNQATIQHEANQVPKLDLARMDKRTGSGATAYAQVDTERNARDLIIVAEKPGGIVAAQESATKFQAEQLAHEIEQRHEEVVPTLSETLNARPDVEIIQKEAKPFVAQPRIEAVSNDLGLGIVTNIDIEQPKAITHVSEADMKDISTAPPDQDWGIFDDENILSELKFNENEILNLQELLGLASTNITPVDEIGQETYNLEEVGASLSTELVIEDGTLETFELLISLVADADERAEDASLELSEIEPGNQIILVEIKPPEISGANIFEEYLESQSETESEPSIDTIRAGSNDQPLVKTLAQLAIAFRELPAENEEVRSVIRDLSEAFSHSNNIIDTKTEVVRITPAIIQKLLGLLRLIGYENPQEALLELVTRHDLEFLAQAMHYLSQLTNLDNQQEFLVLGKRTTFQPSYTEPLAVRIGKIIMGFARPHFDNL